MLNAPKLSKLTKEEYAALVDNIICVDLPDLNEETKLWNLVSTYQIYRHSKTCRKYRNEKYRFDFGKYFKSLTIIAEPNDIRDKLKVEEMEKKNKILRKVKGYIDTDLTFIYDPARYDSEEVSTIEDILIQPQILASEYEASLSMSDDNDFQVHLNRSPNSCFLNNCHLVRILAWGIKLDMQPVFNRYKAVAYIFAFLSKSENECT